MEGTAESAAEAAGLRARQLSDRRQRLLAGLAPTTADVLEAGERAAASFERGARAHDRAAAAHDRAALALERQAHQGPGEMERELLAAAARHRRAAAADRAAAHNDRLRERGDAEAEPPRL